MSKRRAEFALEPPGAPSAMDQRAAQLKERVEALARGTGGALDDCDQIAGTMKMPPMDGTGAAAQMPMLSRSTETGMYLKWSLMLQNEMVRMKTAYLAIKEENVALRAQLLSAGIAPQAPGQAVVGPLHQGIVSAGYPLSRNVSAVSTSNARSETNTNDTTPFDPERVDPTTSTTDRLRDQSDVSPGAEALVMLSSPKNSPKMASTTIVPAMSGVTRYTLPAASCSLPRYTPLVPVDGYFNQPPPFQGLSSATLAPAPAAAVPAAHRPMAAPDAAPVSASAQGSIASAGPSPTPSTSSVFALSQQDELLADLLTTPNLSNLTPKWLSGAATMEPRMGGSPLARHASVASHGETLTTRPTAMAPEAPSGFRRVGNVTWTGLNNKRPV